MLRAGLRRKEWDFSLFTRHLFLSAQAHLGNVPGTTGRPWRDWVFCEFEFGVFLARMRREDPTPGGFRRVSPCFIVQGRRDTKARQGFRAAGLHKDTLHDS